MSFQFHVLDFIGQSRNKVVWFGNFIQLLLMFHYEGALIGFKNA